MRKRILLIVCILAGILLLIVLCGCREPKWSSRSALPKPGAKACVSVTMIKPEIRKRLAHDACYMTKASDYRNFCFTIRCDRRVGSKCQFTVYRGRECLRRHLLYTVQADYRSLKPEVASTVRDSRGSAVARGSQIEEMPVVFREFLVYDRAYLAPNNYKDYTMSNGDRVCISRNDGHRGTWAINLEFLRGPNGVLYYAETQGWHSGDWLWGGVRHAGIDGEWIAKRID